MDQITYIHLISHERSACIACPIAANTSFSASSRGNLEDDAPEAQIGELKRRFGSKVERGFVREITTRGDNVGVNISLDAVYEIEEESPMRTRRNSIPKCLFARLESPSSRSTSCYDDDAESGWEPHAADTPPAVIRTISRRFWSHPDK